jgi:SAM-dependent methyltransferase
MRESFQPIAVHAPSDNWLLFYARCFADLQLLTIFLFLRGRLNPWTGRVLDVGAGESPWRGLMPGATYVGLDTSHSDAFGMTRRQDVVYYDGAGLPFEDDEFDHVLCTEVLEHVGEPLAFLVDLHRVLRPGGTLALTVPWSARVHHVPYDYYRFTPFALGPLLTSAGFSDVAIEERGNDVATIANKLVVSWVGFVRPRRWASAIVTWPLSVLLAPIVGAFLVVAHITILSGVAPVSDPLGYGVTATKPGFSAMT